MSLSASTLRTLLDKVSKFQRIPPISYEDYDTIISTINHFSSLEIVQLFDYLDDLENPIWKPIAPELKTPDIISKFMITFCSFSNFLKMSPAQTMSSLTDFMERSDKFFKGNPSVAAKTLAANSDSTYANHLTKTMIWMNHSDEFESRYIKVADRDFKDTLIAALDFIGEANREYFWTEILDKNFDCFSGIVRKLCRDVNGLRYVINQLKYLEDKNNPRFIECLTDTMILLFKHAVTLKIKNIEEFNILNVVETMKSIDEIF